MEGITNWNNSDFLFLYDATNTNPNGDADQENKPRMDQETKTALVSDVRIKRTIRDFLINKGYEVFVRTLNDEKVTMDTMFEQMMKKYVLMKGEDKVKNKEMEKVKEKITDEEKEKIKKIDNEKKINTILDNMIDIRLFGSAMAVGGITKTFTGPIQINWGYSLHPVDLVKSNSIVTIMNEDNSTFGKMYKLHYALIAHSGTFNKFAAAKTRMIDKDKEVFRKAIVQSLYNNLTHSKQGQQPLLYLEVEYAEDYDGYLGDLRRFLEVQQKKENIRKQEDVTIDFSKLKEAITQFKDKGYIKEVYLWKGLLAQNLINLPEVPEVVEIDLLAAL